MKLSAYSERKLVGVQPKLQKIVRRAAKLAADNKAVDFEIVQGARTQAYQNALYEQGRSLPGNIVTWTRNSKHIGGFAIDFAALDNSGKINWDSKLYPQIASLMQTASKELGFPIIWGGSWKNKDWGHIQLADSRDPIQPGVEMTVPGTKTKVVVPPFQNLKVGSKGNPVVEVQSLLVFLGYLKGANAADGYFGKGTEAAVKAYQKSKKMEESGIVGPLTNSYLHQDYDKKTAPKVEPTIALKDLHAGALYSRLVRYFEGESLDAYEIGGHYHIGIGHNGSSGYPPVVTKGMTITRAEMEQIFASDTLRCEEGLKKILTTPLKQAQFDALLALYFNRERTFQSKYRAGSGVLPADDLIEAVNAQDWARAELEFHELEDAPALDGKLYAGLVKRRRAEADTFAGRQVVLS